MFLSCLAEAALLNQLLTNIDQLPDVFSLQRPIFEIIFWCYWIQAEVMQNVNVPCEAPMMQKSYYY